MMLTKIQLEILNLYQKDIFLAKTIREISKSLKKDYPSTHKAIKDLEKKGIIATNKVGNSVVCKLNLSQESISLLSFLDEQHSFSKNIPNIKKILSFKEFIDDVILVTGSYAKGKNTSKSDIDLVVITKNKVFSKQRLLENLTALLIPKFHPIVTSCKDFTDMLLSREENYGKEIFRNRLLFRNANKYYELVKDAIEHGLKKR